MNITTKQDFDTEVYDQSSSTKQDKDDIADAAYVVLKGKSKEEINQFPYEFLKRVLEIEYDYGIHESLGDIKLGGCKTVEDWMATPLPDCLDEAIRKIIHRRHTEGKSHYLIAQFGWNLGCELATAMLL